MEEHAMQWPECFLTGVVPADRPRDALIADGLSGWACAMGGERPPRFGFTMAEIANRLGIIGTPQEFRRIAQTQA